MNLLVLALLAATTNTQPTNGTNNTTSTQNKSTNKSTSTNKTTKKSTATLTPDPNAPADGKSEKEVVTPAPKKKKGEANAEGPEAGSPAALVGNSFDAATQIANEAAKAAMEEVKRLQAIGGDSAGASPVNAKMAEAGVTGAAAVAKEVKAPKKKSTEEGSSEEPAAKPEKKQKPAKQTEGAEPAKDGKVFGVKVEGSPQK